MGIHSSAHKETRHDARDTEEREQKCRQDHRVDQLGKYQLEPIQASAQYGDKCHAAEFVTVDHAEDQKSEKYGCYFENIDRKCKKMESAQSLLRAQADPEGKAAEKEDEQ